MTDHQATIDSYLDAYSETDASRRSDIITNVWSKDGHLIDPPIDGVGHEGISEMSATVQAHFPGHVFRRTSGVDEHHTFARYEWELVAPDASVALTGLDVAEFDEDGLLRRVIGFMGPIADKDAPQ